MGNINVQLEALDFLLCPNCQGALHLTSQMAALVTQGELTCQSCKKVYPIIHGIPRFVSDQDNYAHSFGYQWNKFKTVQLDSITETTESTDRFYNETTWTKEWLKGKRILELGCGAGRFLEIASKAECQVVGIDLSNAVDAAVYNLKDRNNVNIFQASVYNLPFKKGSFDGVYCIGVIQHMPDPARAMQLIGQYLKPGGKVAVTIYERKFYTKMNTKYLLRLVTSRMNKKLLLFLIKLFMPILFLITEILFRIPFLGRIFRFIIPVANYVEKRSLSMKERYKWVVLDTFDMLSPSYDNPQTEAEVRAALTAGGVGNLVRLNNDGVNIVGEKE